MQAGWFEGVVEHRRSTPQHQFRKHIALALIPLDEIAALERSGALSRRKLASHSLRERDLLQDEPGADLEERVRGVVEKRCGIVPTGRIALLSQLRCWGFGFDPVRFFFCFAPGDRLEAVVAEVTNTPWNERHSYAFATSGTESGEQTLRFETPKAFHVSPFMPMDHQYRFQFAVREDTIHVGIANLRGGRKVFGADLRLERTATGLVRSWRSALRHPWMTAETLLGIYWQAARLTARRAPFHSHP